MVPAAEWTIRPARPVEARAITELVMRSKAHWGYDQAFMAACRDELTVTAEQVAGGMAWVAVSDPPGTLVGFCQVTGAPPEGELSMLFVDPGHMGRGVGRALLEWASTAAGAAGFAILMLDSDPDAEPFYRRMGAELVGRSPSGSISGRMLPRMRLALTRPRSGG